ncbi:hypothetical protein JHK87_056270 [Glycine soja]|nr:hypothetical protein JHK87_056270 [Glycine soja]
MKPPTHYFNHPCPEYDNDIYYDSLPSPNDKEVHSLFSSCSVIQISSKDLTDTNDIQSFVSAEVVLQVVLSKDCDQCYNHRGGQFRIKGLSLKAKQGIASAVGAAGVAVLLMVLACCFKIRSFGGRIQPIG